MAYLFKCYTLPWEYTLKSIALYALCLLYISMVSKIFKITNTDS